MTGEHGTDRRRTRGPRPLRRRLTACGAAALVAVAMQLLSITGAAAAGPAKSAAAGLRAWGFNKDGELGIGKFSMDALRPAAVRIPASFTITSVRAGCAHTVALTSKGEVLSWGSNAHLQLGEPAGLTRTATPIRVAIPPGTKVTAVRAGCFHSLALTSAGQVLAWGANDLGQIGTGDTAKEIGIPVKVKLPAGVTIKAISAGNGHNLALTTTGQIWAWGFNNFGQVGDGTTKERDTPVPVALPPGTHVTAIAAGQDFSMALTASGRVLAWGSNSSGQLGDGTTTQRDTPVQVHLPAGTRVRGVSGGCAHALALTAAGKLLAWGDNSVGQLGTGSFVSRHRPVPVRLPRGATVTQLSAACLHGLALTSKGGVLAWGDDEVGQVGDGDTINVNHPVAVKLGAGLSATGIGAGPVAVISLAIVRKA